MTRTKWTNKIFQRRKLTCIEDIEMKSGYGWYHTLNEIENDFIVLIANTIEKRAVNDIAKFYLTEVLSQIR